MFLTLFSLLLLLQPLEGSRIHLSETCHKDSWHKDSFGWKAVEKKQRQEKPSALLRSPYSSKSGTLINKGVPNFPLCQEGQTLITGDNDRPLSRSHQRKQTLLISTYLPPVSRMRTSQFPTLETRRPFPLSRRFCEHAFFLSLRCSVTPRSKRPFTACRRVFGQHTRQ